MNPRTVGGAIFINLCAVVSVGFGCSGREVSIGENVADGGAQKDAYVAGEADAGSDASIINDAGTPKPSGEIACGSGSTMLTCKIDLGEVCCTPKGLPSGKPTCEVGGCTGPNSTSVACDGPEDCGGQVCCQVEAPDPSAGDTACAPTCSTASHARVCHTDSECAIGETCCPPGAPTHGRCMASGC